MWSQGFLDDFWKGQGVFGTLDFIFWVVSVAFIFVLATAIGWFLIIGAFFKFGPHWVIGWDSGWAGTMAFIAMWIYTVFWGVYVLVGLFGWNRYRPAKEVPLWARLWAGLSKQTLPGGEYAQFADKAAEGEVLDLAGMAEGVEPRTGESSWVRKRRAKQYREEARLLAEEEAVQRAEAEVHEAEAEVHRRAEEFNKAKARVDMARKLRRKSRNDD